MKPPSQSVGPSSASNASERKPQSRPASCVTKAITSAENAKACNTSTKATHWSPSCNKSSAKNCPTFPLKANRTGLIKPRGKHSNSNTGVVTPSKKNHSATRRTLRLSAVTATNNAMPTLIEPAKNAWTSISANYATRRNDFRIIIPLCSAITVDSQAVGCYPRLPT